MNMTHIIHNYYSTMDLDNVKKGGFLSKPEKIKMQINENGLLKVKGKRYLRLGKINLFDPVESKHISDSEFVGVLDTNTGEILCFDINRMYKEYIQSGANHVLTDDNRTYKICSQTKDIVMNTVLEQRRMNTISDFI